MITKGALESVLALCSQIQTYSEDVALEGSQQAQFQKRFESWSSQGYRVLVLAVKDVCRQDHSFSSKDEHEITFVGFLLFLDPPKQGAQNTIAALEKLGVRLKIITGDNHLVARHIGQVVGFGNFNVMSGGQLDDLGDEALWHAMEQTTIFSEVCPNPKERIILVLKKRGHVIGYDRPCGPIFIILVFGSIRHWIMRDEWLNSGSTGTRPGNSLYRNSGVFL